MANKNTNPNLDPTTTEGTIPPTTITEEAPQPPAQPTTPPNNTNTTSNRLAELLAKRSKETTKATKVAVNLDDVRAATQPVTLSQVDFPISPSIMTFSGSGGKAFQAFEVTAIRFSIREVMSTNPESLGEFQKIAAGNLVGRPVKSSTKGEALLLNGQPQYESEKELEIASFNMGWRGGPNGGAVVWSGNGGQHRWLLLRATGASSSRTAIDWSKYQTPDGQGFEATIKAALISDPTAMAEWVEVAKAHSDATNAARAAGVSGGLGALGGNNQQAGPRVGRLRTQIPDETNNPLG